MTARPLVVVGPTAAGKSAVALAVVRALGDRELVSVDSMQVYRGMDIGTAKPTQAERREVPHHCIDLVDPDVVFTVVDHRAAADAAAAEIGGRGHEPVYVGGTGLYVRAIVDRLEPPPRFPALAAELDREADTEALHARLRVLDPVGAGRMEPTNRRRVLRALEVTIGSGRPFSSHGDGLERYDPSVPFDMVAVECPTEILDSRIEQRYRDQMESGFLAEVERLLARPGGLGRTARQALGYKELAEHMAGRIDLDEALDAAVRRTKRFARRQRAWFGRDPRIRWISHDGNPLVIADQLLRESDQCS